MIRNLEQRLERLEQAILTSDEPVAVICVRFVPYGTLKGLKNDRGFYCGRLPGESEEALEARACELQWTDLSRTSRPAMAFYALMFNLIGQSGDLADSAAFRRAPSASLVRNFSLIFEETAHLLRRQNHRKSDRLFG